MNALDEMANTSTRSRNREKTNDAPLPTRLKSWLHIRTPLCNKENSRQTVAFSVTSMTPQHQWWLSLNNRSLCNFKATNFETANVNALLSALKLSRVHSISGIHRVR